MSATGRADVGGWKKMPSGNRSTDHALERFWLVVAIIGAIVPLIPFVAWLGDHGLDPSRFVDELFANRISTFFGLDVLISAVVVLAMVWIDDRLPGRAKVLAATTTCCLGVSCGLPLLLFLRERAVSIDIMSTSQSG
jgi:hypothetical protein